jgi:ABC-type polysaccharide/polyol phosphate export permease
MFAHFYAASKEARMSKFITFHRWTSITFALVVAAIFVVLALGQQPAQWIYYLPLLPLFFLMLTGLYLFALPYFSKRETR